MVLLLVVPSGWVLVSLSLSFFILGCSEDRGGCRIAVAGGGCGGDCSAGGVGSFGVVIGGAVGAVWLAVIWCVMVLVALSHRHFYCCVILFTITTIKIAGTSCRYKIQPPGQHWFRVHGLYQGTPLTINPSEVAVFKR